MKTMKFNDFLPFNNLSDSYAYFLNVIPDNNLVDKISNLYSDLLPSKLVAISMKFRDKYYNRDISENVINSPLTKLYAPSGYFPYNTQGRQNFSAWFRYSTTPYLYRWNKLIDNVYSQIYEPLDNYNGTETETIEYIGSETHSIVQDHKDNNTTNNTLESSQTTATNQYKNAFNSSQSTPTANTSANGTDNTTASENAQKTSTANDIDTKSFTDRQDKRTLNKRGNLGVTSSQQMLASELEFRLKNDFLEAFFSDLCKIFFDPIY